MTVLHRRVKNQRLTAAGYIWAFTALTASAGARAHYDRRRAAGDRHAYVQTGQGYGRSYRFPTAQTEELAAAA